MTAEAGQLLDAHVTGNCVEEEALELRPPCWSRRRVTRRNPSHVFAIYLAALKAEKATAVENLRFAVDSGVQFAGWQEARSALGKLTVLR